MLQQQLTGDSLAIANAIDKQQSGLLARANVQGVGIGHKIKGGVDTGTLSLTVFVSHKVAPGLLSDTDKIPKQVDKIPTDVIETGMIFAGGTSQAITPQELGVQTLATRVRPVEGGYSVGHFKITAGTMATAVIDATPYPAIPRAYYMLSNNHVLANSNDARLGDAILQPGPHDGGTFPNDVVARLARFVPIRFDGSCNFVDAAIAEGPFHWLDREIYWLGYVQGVATVEVGQLVQKTGRTTNYTTGQVIAINATVNVNYGGGKVATMCRQIVTGNMSAGGDSGSLLCDMNRSAVGLLFAGSSAVTIHNDIRFVQALLGIRLV